MNGQMHGTQRPALRTSHLAATILSCSLLLAGCAHPPQAAPLSTAIAVPEQTPSVTRRAGPADAGAPESGENPTTGGEPIITFEKNIHDLGEVGTLSRNACEFRFKNTGTGVLKVREKIETTCGCTAAALSQTEYAPGQEGVVQVTFLAGDVLGATVKTLVVHSNDKTNEGKAILGIKATVVERVVCQPRQLELRLKGPNAGCPPITVRSLDQKSFSIRRIASTGGAITARCDPLVHATEFTLRPTLEAGQLQQYPTGTLLLALTHPACSELHISYHTVPEFQLTPSFLILFNAEPNRPLRRDAWVSNNYGEEFEIASCVSAANMVQVLEKEKVVSADNKSVRYHLRLSLTPPFLVGDKRVIEDTLAIHLTNGQVVQLPCRVFYRRPRVPRPEVPRRDR